VYTMAGVQKLSPIWTPLGDYSAIYWVLQSPNWRRFDMRWTAWIYPLTQVATALTWFWEVSAPALLLVFYFRRTRDRPGRLRRLFNARDLRLVYAGFGVVVHTSIFVLMDVGPFSFIALAFYFLLWSPREWRRANPARCILLRRRRPANLAGC